MVSTGSKRLRIRPAREQDIPDLLSLEVRAFEDGALSRRSFRRFLSGTGSVLLVATQERMFAGYALVLFRPRSPIARLYSLAVSGPAARRGVGVALITAVEGIARRRRCKVLRIDIPQKHAAGAACCRKAGFQDLDDAARRKKGMIQLEKPLYKIVRSPA